MEQPRKKRRGIFSTRSLVILIIGIGIGYLLGLMVSIPIKNKYTAEKDAGFTRPYQDGFQAILEQELVDGSGVNFSVRVKNELVLGRGRENRIEFSRENFLAIQLYSPITERQQKKIREELEKITGVLEVKQNKFGFGIRRFPVDEPNDEKGSHSWPTIFNQAKVILIEVLVPRK